nr:CotH kinase family protein [Kiritimatiellia bacterium]
MNPCPSPLRCLALLAVLCFCLAPAVRAQDPRGFHGRWNDWNHEPMTLDRGAWRVTMQAVAADDNDFKIAETDWTYEWTHNGSLLLGEAGTAYTSGDNTAIEAVPGRWYTIAMDNVNSGVQGRMIVQETQAEPVGIVSVDPAVAESNAVVTLATSAAPGPGERLFVRYTFHNWTSSAFAEASGAGTNWTAEIPHAPENAGRTCAFYALSSTVTNPGHANADLQTLRWNDNAGAGYSYLVPGEPPPARLYINEVLSSNDSSEQDEDGDYSDWLEIWNDSATAVNLDGWGLSDSDSNPFKWTFGDVTIQAGEFLVVWASSKNRPAVTNGNQLHAGFSISAGGEELLLTQPDGTLMDRFEPVAIPTDFSYGRQPDGTGPWKYFTDHTPGAPNTTTGYTAILEPPVYSISGGFFTTNVEVTLSTSQTGAVIRYTLDGSEPTESSPVFTNALVLGSKAGTPNDLSVIPTNFEPTGPDYYEGWQPPDGEVFKFHVLRARTFQEGALPSPAVTRSYLVDAAGTNRYSLPVVSIATDAANLFDDDIGIYTPVNDNMLQSGSDWERPGTIEFFEPGGALAFDGPIGIRLHGNTTRNRPRKALRIYARGSGPFEYQIFPDKPVAEFDTFILRNGGNDWGNGVIRDLFLQSLAENARLDRQFGRPVLVFLNGEYWGLHDLRDRFDDGYILHHYDLDEDEFVQVELDRETATPNIPVYDDGNEALGGDYAGLWEFMRTNDLSTSDAYAAVADRLDTGSFMDFFQANIFFGNTDWPGNNLRAWRSVETNRTEDAPAFLDARWRYMLYDADFGFGLDFVYVPGSSNYVFQPGQTDFGTFARHDTLAFAANDTSEGAYWSNEPDGTLMFRRLLDNDGFRRDFVIRFCDQLNTAYSRAHVTNRWAQWVDLLAPEMPEHAARWRQPTNWTSECDRIRAYGEQRTAAVWDHLRDFFDLSAPVNLTVNVADPEAGFVRVNTLDLDADTAGFTGYPWTGAYFTNYPVTLTAVERTGYQFIAWFKNAEVFSSDPSIELILTNAAQFEAVFAENLPPQIVAPGIVFQQLIEDTAPVQFDLDSIFFDPEGAPLTFDASTGDSNLVAVAVPDSTLSVTPLRRGEATVTVTASDGTTTADLSFRVLVHPAPHVLQNGAFTFGEWDPELPEKTYPEHMLFLQSDQDDPEINTPLPYAYYIAHDDYHADDADKIGFP